MEAVDSKYEFRQAMMLRTKQFALRIIRLVQSLPKTQEANVIGKKFFRRGTSGAAK